MGSFLKSIFLRAAFILPTVLGLILALITFTLIDKDMNRATRFYIVSTITLATLLVSTFLSGYEVFMISNKEPAKVRSVTQATHYYAGFSMLILDRRPWIGMDQILTMFVKDREKEEPIGLIRIVAFTSVGYPQGVIFSSFDKSFDELDSYLLDTSRWTSLFVKEGITAEYIERSIERLSDLSG